MARLAYGGILEAMSGGDIIIAPFEPENVGPCSVDLRLGGEMMKFDLSDPHRDDGGIDTHVEPKLIPHLPFCEENGQKLWSLAPGRLYLAHTLETIRVDRFSGTVVARSSFARYGITVEQAGFIDDGFCGQIVLELSVIHPAVVYSGDRICQIAFDQLVGERRPYSSRGHSYQSQTGARGPKPTHSGRR